MSKYVIEQKLPSGHFAVQVRLGGKTSPVKNLPENLVSRFVRDTIISRLQAYINHRKEIMQYHGGYVDMRRNQALTRLMLRIGSADKWTTTSLAKHIKLMKEDMIAVMPGLSSKYYEYHSELIRDLNNWANEYELNYMQHYGHVC